MLAGDIVCFSFYSEKINVLFAVLKSDLMASLDKEVKSLDEDSWMFDGPRSRIHRISRPGSSRRAKMIVALI